MCLGLLKAAPAKHHLVRRARHIRPHRSSPTWRLSILCGAFSEPRVSRVSKKVDGRNHLSYPRRVAKDTRNSRAAVGIGWVLGKDRMHAGWTLGRTPGLPNNPKRAVARSDRFRGGHVRWPTDTPHFQRGPFLRWLVCPGVGSLRRRSVDRGLERGGLVRVCCASCTNFSARRDSSLDPPRSARTSRRVPCRDVPK